MAKMTAGDIWPTLKETVNDWLEDKAPKLAAALALYTMLSIGPLLVIVLMVVGKMYGDEAAAGKLGSVLAGVAPPQAAAFAQDVAAKAGEHGEGILATVLSFLMLAFTASGVFGELQDSLNTIWEVKLKPNQGVWAMIRARFLSFTMVLGLAFLFMVSTVGTTILTTLGDNLSGGNRAVAYVVGTLLSMSVMIGLFAMIFKYLPDVNITWKDVIFGAVLTGVLFEIGKQLLSWYLSRGSTTSVYGAAGSLAVLLLYIYYSAQIVFFGAEFTQVYSRKFGSGIQPAKNAIPITDVERLKQGMEPGARQDPPIQPPRVVRITPPAKVDPKAPMVFGGGGVAAGLLLGVVGAYVLRRARPTKGQAAALELNSRLDSVEQRMMQIKGLYDTAYNLNRPAPKVMKVPKIVEVPKVMEVPKFVKVPTPPPDPSWRTALHNAVWRHPVLWPIAKAFNLDRLKTR